MRNWNRVLSFALCLCLLLGYFPAGAMAQDSGTDPVTQETRDTGSSADETTAPADETTAPADETTAPADETTAPADETTAPADPVYEGFTWNDDMEVLDGSTFRIPNVSADHQADFDTVVSMLPSSVTLSDGTVAEIDHWECKEFLQDEEGNWPVSGSYSFQAILSKQVLFGENAPELKITVELSASVSLMVLEPVDYIGADGQSLQATEYTELTAEMTSLEAGIYVANGALSFSAPLILNGNVTLILADGCVLTASRGINTNGNSLTIFSQTQNTGVLNASGSDNDAGIGGSGAVSIYGGKITAVAGAFTAGIGGDGHRSGCTVTIAGKAIVNATGGQGENDNAGGAGIGGGYNGTGNVTIAGNAVVNAVGGKESAGIGGGAFGAGNVTISGGANVTASSSGYGAGIGGGSRNQGTVIIGGSAKVTSTAVGDYGAGIGGGWLAEGKVTIKENANVTAFGSCNGSGIGGSSDGYGDVSIQGNAIVKATGNHGGSGIGGGAGQGCNVTIEGSAQVEAKGGDFHGAGIGSGTQNKTEAVVDIKGNAKVTATAGGSGAAIGTGGYNPEHKPGAVTISGNPVVHANAESGGCAIGGGMYHYADVVISGGTIITGDNNSIGDGSDPSAVGSFSTGTDGTAYIKTQKIKPDTNRSSWKGYIIEGGSITVGGDQTLKESLTIPVGETLKVNKNGNLTIPEGMTLTVDGNLIIDGTVTNNGSIQNHGMTTVNGAAAGSGSFGGDGSLKITWDSALGLSVTGVPQNLVYNGKDQEGAVLSDIGICKPVWGRSIGVRDWYFKGYEKKVDENFASTDSIKDAGTYRVVFYRSGTDPEERVTEEFTIAKAPGSGTLTMADWTYGSTASEPVLASDTHDPAAAVITYAPAGSEAFAGEKPSDAGSYTVKAVFPETDNYLKFTIESAFKINQKPIDTSGLTWTADSVSYNGNPRSMVLSSVPAGIVASYQNNEGTNAGTYNAVATLTAEDPNFVPSVKEYLRTFTITKAASDFHNLTAGSSVAYGETLTVSLVPGIKGGSPAAVPYAAAETGSSVELWLGNNKAAELTKVKEGSSVTLNVVTTDKGIPAAYFDGQSHDFTLKWGGDQNLESCEKTVSVTLNKKELTAAFAAGTGKTYDGSKLFENISLSLNGVQGTDDVAAAASGTLDTADAAAAPGTDVTTVTLSGAHKDYYQLNAANVTGTCMIHKRVAELGWNKTTQPFDGTARQPEVYIKNLVTGDTATVSVNAAYIDAGTYPVTAVSIDNGNYALPTDCTVSFTIQEAAPTLTPPTANTLFYKGEAQELISAGSALNGILQYSLDGTNYAVSIPTGLAAGEYTVSYRVIGNKNYSDIAPKTITVSISNDFVPKKDTEYQVSADDWTNEDFVVTAKDGFELSLQNLAGSPFADSLTASAEGKDQTLTFYVRNKLTGAISQAVSETYQIDKTAPTVTAALQTASRALTSSNYYHEDVDLVITSEDSLSGIKSVSYLESQKALSQEELASSTQWKDYGSGHKVTAVNEKKVYCYAKVTDNAGNTAYASAGPAVFDLTAPVITTIKEGTTFYTDAFLKISDDNLESITFASSQITETRDAVGVTSIWQSAPSSVTLPVTWTATVRDLAGNETSFTYTVRPLSEITTIPADADGNPITENNVTSAYEKQIAKQLSEVNAHLAGDRISFMRTAHTDALTAALPVLQKLDDRIKAVGKTLQDNSKVIDDLTPLTVKSEDQAEIEKAQAALKQLSLQKPDNLTEEEKAAIALSQSKAETLLKKIAEVQKTLNDHTKTVDALTSENVKAADAEALQNSLNALKSLNPDNLTAEEKAEADAAIKKAESLLTLIAPAKKVLDEDLKAVEKLTEETVKSSDKQSLETAKKNLMALDLKRLTTEEKAKVDAAVKKADSLIRKISEVKEPLDQNTSVVEKVPADKVTSEDKAALQEAKKNLEALQKSDNLTEEEKKAAASEISRAQAMLDTIDQTEKDLEDCRKNLEKVSIESVNSDDQAALKETEKKLNELAVSDHLTKDQKKTVKAEKIRAAELLERIQDAYDAAHRKEIEDTRNLTKKNVLFKHRKALETARDQLDKAIKAYEGNYTKKELEAVKQDLQRVKDAILALDHASYVISLIDPLPKKMKDGDNRTMRNVEKARIHYENLTAHERELVGGPRYEKLMALYNSYRHYEIIPNEKNDQNSEVHFQVTGSFEKFAEIRVDDHKLLKEDYRAKAAANGTTEIILSEDFLKTLGYARHTIEVDYTDGIAMGSIQNKRISSTWIPRTGDENHPQAWIAVMVISGAGIAALAAVYVVKKKKKQ